METAFPVINNRTALKAGLGRLQSGDILSVKIIKNSKGLIKASINGKILNLRGSADIKAGQILKVRAVWSAKTLLLERIDTENSMKNLLTQTGFKADTATMLLFETAKRAGLPLKGHYLSELKRFLRKAGKFSPEDARAAVECIKKGLSAENIIHSITSGDSSDYEEHQKSILFNSLANGDELWFVVPYNFRLQNDESGVSGSLRIKKNLKSGRIEKAVIDSKACNTAGGARYFFVIDNYSSAERTIRVLAEGLLSKKEKLRIKRALPEILGNLSLKIDDNIIEDCFGKDGAETAFDGFELIESSFAGIEAVV